MSPGGTASLLGANFGPITSNGLCTTGQHAQLCGLTCLGSKSLQLVHESLELQLLHAELVNALLQVSQLGKDIFVQRKAYQPLML
eukprot:CAMPEP_0197714542 /NCGR_PEP_ID=MMETSP1338-20131121/131012_1 /TAXON_ID=43686 ORGANISM="Pelagodinium beii, Strain RCC1491" /NCGR_SAMPLE_ID=MMETSP1338 /ASSEMBLY_ACC=CAM_ASM_000754 /LENGTH=84 /DNA_ID=CAMNT_0043298485 /DNA_START=449 /DNA_END=698 /DNA_ORIENTATION=-